MVKYISIGKDILGQDYVVLKFEKDEIVSILNKFIQYHVDKDKPMFAYELTKNQSIRDGDKFHSTVLSVSQFNKNPTMAKSIKGMPVEIELLGIGKAIDKRKTNDNESHFIVINSPALQTIRTDMGFKEKQFHITIGFKEKDVFNSSKGNDSIYIDLK